MKMAGINHSSSFYFKYYIVVNIYKREDMQ